MFQTTPSQSICLSITRLRSGAITCCWIVGLALACQALIWSLASYTQLRYAEAPTAEVTKAAPIGVKSEPQPPARGRILAPPGAEAEAAAGPGAAPKVVVEEVPATVLSGYDRLFGSAFELAGGAGRIAMIVLVAVLGLGVALGANAAVTGAERTVLAFIWATLVAVLVLPLGGALHLPWEDGALTTYAIMTSWVDQVEAAKAAALAGDPLVEAAPSSLVFHARFLFLPVASIIGVILVGLRFSVAVEAAVLKRESMRLDPALEREASNIAPTSLHGARGASIISRTITPPSTMEPNAGPAPAFASEQPADAPPKRLI